MKETELEICEFLLQATSEEEKHVHRYVCIRVWNAEKFEIPELLMSLVRMRIRNQIRMSLKPGSNHVVREQFSSWISNHQFEYIYRIKIRFFNKTMIGIELEDLTDDQYSLGNANKRLGIEVAESYIFHH